MRDTPTSSAPRHAQMILDDKYYSTFQTWNLTILKLLTELEPHETVGKASRVEILFFQ